MSGEPHLHVGVSETPWGMCASRGRTDDAMMRDRRDESLAGCREACGESRGS